MSLATENKCAMSCDWLSFTYKPDISKALVYNHVDRTYDDMVHNEFDCFLLDFPEIADIMIDSCFLRCRTHYDHVLAFDDWFRISYNDTWSDAKNGVNVQIPSHGLEKFASLLLPDYNGDNILQDLLKLLYLRSCQVSRIDLAFDDYSKKFMPKDYAIWYMNGQISTRCHSGHFNFSEASKGHTFYLGSRRTKLLRIYDKDYESNGEINAVRYEWEFHSQYARHIQKTIIENGYIGFADLMKETMSVKVDSNDSKRSRRADLQEWVDFVDLSFSEELPRFTLPVFKKSPTQEKLNNYIERNVMPCLAAYVKMLGRDGYTLLHELIESAEINPKYSSIINRVIDVSFVDSIPPDSDSAEKFLNNPPDYGH